MFRRLLFVVCLSLAGSTAAHAKPAGENWKLSFELAFGEDSPYSRKYPSLYGYPYQINQAITKNVLDRIIPIALKESGAQQTRRLYGPGGYRNYPVTPSAQLEIRATPTAMRNALNIIGYLAQQTEVIVSRPQSNGETVAVEILEENGRRLADPPTVEHFWNRLRVRAPQLQGFLPLWTQGRPGIQIMDTAHAWTRQDLRSFDAAVERTAVDTGLHLRTKQFQVQLMRSGNDWKRQPRGQGYLHRIGGRGRVELMKRLAGEYQPRVDGWIRAAYKKYAERKQVKVSRGSV